MKKTSAPTTPHESEPRPTPKRRDASPADDDRPSGNFFEPLRYVDPKTLKPHPVNEQIYEPHLDDEWEADVLKALRNRTLEPAIVTPDRIIVAGHRRWLVATKHDEPEFPIVIKKIDNPVKALIEYNRHRVKSPWELSQEADFYEAELRKEAKQRQVEAAREAGKYGVLGGRGHKKPLDPTGVPEGFEPPVRAADRKKRRSRVQAAAIIGVSPTTLENIKKIKTSRDATPELSRPAGGGPPGGGELSHPARDPSGQLGPLCRAAK